MDDASVSEEARVAWQLLESRVPLSGGRLKLHRHQVGTGGPSTGRNDVIDRAEGRYVLFLDDDNLIAPGALADLVSVLEQTSSEYVSLRRKRGERTFAYSTTGIHEGLTRSQSLWTFLIGGAFSLRVIRERGLRFDSAVNYGEDSEFVMAFVVAASRFAALSDRDYVIESDPQPGELPHISQASWAGVRADPHRPRGPACWDSRGLYPRRNGTITAQSADSRSKRPLLPASPHDRALGG